MFYIAYQIYTLYPALALIVASLVLFIPIKGNKKVTVMNKIKFYFPH